MCIYLDVYTMCISAGVHTGVRLHTQATCRIPHVPVPVVMSRVPEYWAEELTDTQPHTMEGGQIDVPRCSQKSSDCQATLLSRLNQSQATTRTTEEAIETRQ